MNREAGLEPNMTKPTDQELLERWRREPAPLLPLLHAFHERDGVLSDDALRQVSKALGIPLAELFGTVTFYHHFARENGDGTRTPRSLGAPRVCVGPVCATRGGVKLLQSLREREPGACAMPCAGRCDDPIPVLRGSRVLTGPDADRLVESESPLPVENPGGFEECVFREIRHPGRAGVAGYRESGGYEGLSRALEMTPQEVVSVITESKLSGRGGAGFPTGLKWKAVADAPGEPKTIVCNADEGEPGCFKDRALLDHDPHAVIEGMVIAAYATGARRGFIYLRYEYPQTLAILTRAIEEAEAAGFAGANIQGTQFEFRLYLRRGAGAYICGEEGSLLNSIEGKHPFPRNRPPFPVTHGYQNLPTVVNNVETLASVPQILRLGADWYRGIGRNGNAGTKLISLSGDILRPGNYEVPQGLPLPVLLHDWAGGPSPGRTIRAVTMAGLSGGFLAREDLDVTLDEAAVRSKGSMLGAGGIMVFDDTRNMLEVAHGAMEFFREESCGKCFPCRIGTERLVERLAGEGPADFEEWQAEVQDIGETMKAVSACGLGMAAPLITESLLKHFPDQVREHVQS